VLSLDLFHDQELKSQLTEKIKPLLPPKPEKLPQLAPPPAAPPAPASAIQSVQWGVVFGAYNSLDEAKKIQGQAAAEGLANTSIYKNGTYYELATPFDTKPEAQRAAALLKSRKISDTPQVIDINRWCPHPIPREGFFEGDPKENKYIRPHW
jgi:cell division protein FtsN